MKRLFNSTGVLTAVFFGFLMVLMLPFATYAGALHDELESIEPDLAKIKKLIDSGVDVNEPSTGILGKRYPIDMAITAAGRHRLEIIRLLIKAGADVNVKDEYGSTPLHTAALTNSEETINLLIKYGAKVSAKDTQGKTPLHVAASYSASRAARALLTHGADPMARDKDGNTPLHYITIKESTKDAIKTAEILINAGADPNARGEFNRTPLFTVTENTELYAYLLKRGAKLNVRDKFGKSLFHDVKGYIDEKGVDQTVRWLVKKGLDVNSKDNEGNTPLIDAAANGMILKVKTLLALGARVNETNRAGETALHKAAFYASMYPDKIALIKLLLKNGADPSIRDLSGRLPSEIAYNKDVKALLSKVSEAKVTSTKDWQATVREIARTISTRIDEKGRAYVASIKAAQKADDLGSVYSKEDLNRIIKTMRQYEQAAMSLLGIFRDAEKMALELAKNKGLPSSYNKSLMAEIKKVLKAKEASEAESRLSLDIALSQALAYQYQILKDTWGHWRLDRKNRRIDFDSPEVRDRVVEAFNRVGKAKERIMRYLNKGS